MAKFRILHFSDVHLGLREFHARYLLDKRLFGRLNQFLRRASNFQLARLERLADLQRDFRPDCTVCTGDLTTIGSADEFHAVAEAIADVRRHAAHFLYVPGNHDAYVSANRDAIADACRLFSDGRFGLEDFPLSLQVGPVEFIALNSCLPRPVWLSSGKLPDAVWPKLNYILEKNLPAGQMRVMLNHFPLADADGKPLSWRRQMNDFARLREMLPQGHVRALLCGHIHTAYLRDLAPEGALQVCAGSLGLRGTCAAIEADTQTGAVEAKIVQL